MSASSSRQASLLPARLRQGFSALGVRNYRLFWLGQLISLTGTWMQTTAQAWLVLQLTDSPAALGVVAVCQFLPITLLSLFAGVVTDRFPRYRLLLGTQTAFLLQALVFGLLTASGHIALWHVYVLAALQGVITAIDNPTRQAFVPELIERERLANAVALNSLLFNGARIVGAAFGGLVIAQVGIAPALLLNAASFVAVIAELLRMDTRNFRTPADLIGQSVLGEVLEGLTYVARTPKVLTILLIVTFVGTFGYNFSVVLPLLAGYVLHTDAAGFGGLSAFLGVGSLVAALVMAFSQQVAMRRLVFGASGFSVLLGALALSRSYPLSAVLLVFLGFMGIIFATSANTLLQLTVPDRLRGRVMSLYILLFVGSTPIGSLLIGGLSSLIGGGEALLVCAIIALAGVVSATLYLWRVQQRSTS